MKSHKLILSITLFVFIFSNIQSSEVVEFLPINSQILMLHFDDGYVIHHKRGESRWSNERAIVQVLDVEKAVLPESYKLTDSKGFEIKISKIGRKTKPTEIALKMDGLNHADEHWIYLYLENPLLSGESLNLSTSLAGNGSNFKLDFTENLARSEAIHVNQIGYSNRSEAKFGYVSHWAGNEGSVDFSTYSGNSFHLVNIANQQIEFTGKLNFRSTRFRAETLIDKDSPNRNYSASEVWECDFSAFNPKNRGEYILVIEGIGSSFPFEIDNDVLRKPFETVMRGLYHHRSGIELKSEYTNVPHPAAAHPLLTPGFEHRMKYTARRNCDLVYSEDNREAPAILVEMKGELLTYGFYQDAGDWDGYFSHLRVPLLLMTVYEIAPANFADNEFNIPESGNGIPDILDEAAWLLKYYHRTRNALMNTRDSLGKPYGTGGAAGSRVAGDFFGSDEKDGKSIPSWEDNHRDYIVTGEDPFDSYYYSGLAAQMAYILKAIGKYNPEKADWKTQAYDENYDWTRIDWEREAEETFAWAQKNTREGDEKKGLSTYRFFAASSLYRLTGKEIYNTSIITDYEKLGSVSGLKMLMSFPYLSLPLKMQNPEIFESLQKQIINQSLNKTVENAELRAYRFGGNVNYPVFVGQATSPMVEEAIVGYYLTKNQKILNGFYTTVDYVLGNNPLNICWATQVGDRCALGVFNMNYWGNGYLITEEKPGLLSGFDISKMAPGIVPYGPTAHGKSWIPDSSPYGANWPDKFVYPSEIERWPAHELWYDQWCAPPSAEYTVHQTIVSSATMFGILCGEHPDALKYKPVIP